MCSPKKGNRSTANWKFMEKVVELILSLQGDRHSEEHLVEPDGKSAGSKCQQPVGVLNRAARHEPLRAVSDPIYDTCMLLSLAAH